MQIAIKPVIIVSTYNIITKDLEIAYTITSVFFLCMRLVP